MAKRQHQGGDTAIETSLDLSDLASSPGVNPVGYAIEWDQSVNQAAASASAAPASSQVENLRAAKRAIFESLGGMQTVSAAASAAIASAASTGTQSASLENIRGIGWGVRLVNGSLYPELAVKVLVGKKLPMSKVAPEARILEDRDGVPVDVVEVGDIYASAFVLQGRYPRGQANSPGVPCGASCANPIVMEGGTIGALVILQNGKLAFLSNNHVIGHQYNNAPFGTPRGQIGNPIVQPSHPFMGTSPQDNIGLLENCVPLEMGGTTINFVDGAVAVTHSSLVSPAHGPHPGGNSYSMPARPASYLPTEQELPLNVVKVGMRTGKTMGRLTDLEIDGLTVGYGPQGLYGTAVFHNQYLIEGPFGDGGDSGSIVVEKQSLRPLALFFATSNNKQFHYATPIEVVRSQLGIHRIIGGDETAPYAI